MQKCVERGCRSDGVLPGGLKIVRCAPKLFRELTAGSEAATNDPLVTLDWVSLWAMAVNEENAAGGRVVTAPTNGAAGIIPAVLYYSSAFKAVRISRIGASCSRRRAIGILYKRNASISVRGSRLPGRGWCRLLDGGRRLVRNTGRHAPGGKRRRDRHGTQPGLTCDPIGGLVQVPCIERNAMGAVKAINAARLAMRGDGTHSVSLDKVIRTMRQTGADMTQNTRKRRAADLR